jgi:hypothetical protein
MLVVVVGWFLAGFYAQQRSENEWAMFAYAIVVVVSLVTTAYVTSLLYR